MKLRYGVALYLAVSLVCNVIDCRPQGDGVKSVKRVKGLPSITRLVDGDRSGAHGVATSGSTDDVSVSGSHTLQESSELSRGSDTGTLVIRGDASDPETGLSGASATGALGARSNTETASVSAAGSNGGDGSGAGSRGISGNTEHEGSVVARSQGFDRSGVKTKSGGEDHRKVGSIGLGGAGASVPLGLDVDREIDIRSGTGSYGTEDNSSVLVDDTGIHGISGNTDHEGSGVARSQGFDRSGVKTAGIAHRVDGIKGHDSGTKTLVRKFGVIACSRGRRLSNVGEPGLDERGGRVAISENGAQGFGGGDTDKSRGLVENSSGQKSTISGIDSFVSGGTHGGNGNVSEEPQTTFTGTFDGSRINDSAVEKAGAFSESSSEVHSGSSLVSGFDNASGLGNHAGSGSQSETSASGSSSSPSSHSSSGSEEVKSRKKLPVGVNG